MVNWCYLLRNAFWREAIWFKYESSSYSQRRDNTKSHKSIISNSTQGLYNKLEQIIYKSMFNF